MGSPEPVKRLGALQRGTGHPLVLLQKSHRPCVPLRLHRAKAELPQRCTPPSTARPVLSFEQALHRELATLFSPADLEPGREIARLLRSAMSGVTTRKTAKVGDRFAILIVAGKRSRGVELVDRGVRSPKLGRPPQNARRVAVAPAGTKKRHPVDMVPTLTQPCVSIRELDRLELLNRPFEPTGVHQSFRALDTIGRGG